MTILEEDRSLDSVYEAQDNEFINESNQNTEAISELGDDIEEIIMARDAISDSIDKSTPDLIDNVTLEMIQIKLNHMNHKYAIGDVNQFKTFSKESLNFGGNNKLEKIVAVRKGLDIAIEGFFSKMFTAIKNAFTRLGEWIHKKSQTLKGLMIYARDIQKFVNDLPEEKAKVTEPVTPPRYLNKAFGPNITSKKLVEFHNTQIKYMKEAEKFPIKVIESINKVLSNPKTAVVNTDEFIGLKFGTESEPLVGMKYSIVSDGADLVVFTKREDIPDDDHIQILSKSEMQSLLRSFNTITNGLDDLASSFFSAVDSLDELDYRISEVIETDSGERIEISRGDIRFLAQHLNGGVYNSYLLMFNSSMEYIKFSLKYISLSYDQFNTGNKLETPKV